MGTRAAFWVGDPRDIDAREWLGCLSWDGYPDGHGLVLRDVSDESSFRQAVETLARTEAQQFAHPSQGWPFPWEDDVFLTDYTYAWIAGQVMATCFHSGFRPLEDYLREVPQDEDNPETLPHDVKAPSSYNPEQPDSILIIL